MGNANRPFGKTLRAAAISETYKPSEGILRTQVTLESA